MKRPIFGQKCILADAVDDSLFLSRSLSLPMENHAESPRQDFHSILCLGSLCKAFWKTHQEKAQPANTTNFKSINEALKKAFNDKKGRERSIRGLRSFRYNGSNKDAAPWGRGLSRARSMDHFPRCLGSSPLSTPALSRNPSRTSLSNIASRRCSIPIMFSNSSGLFKPPAIDITLECTLEELCFGCVKKMMITRDVVTNNGYIDQEEEMLTIKVKPGWTKGTKITFEGMGNEIPGVYSADVNFVISEKRHPLFTREGDDLQLAIEIPLLKALTGGSLPVPLLGGERMSLTMEDIVYPGYEKVIPGQGMPNPIEQGERGNLIIKFLVQFPTNLTEEQRSDVSSILQDAC